MEQSQVIYFDALSIAQPHRSGVAHTLQRTLEAYLELNPKIKIILIVSLGKAKHLPRSITKYPNVSVKTIPLPNKVFEVLMLLRLIPPVDLFLGRGIYVFPNFKNWPLWNSRSITYIHDLTFKRYPEFVEEKNLIFLNHSIDRWVRRSDMIITVSEHAKQEIHELLHVPESAISVIYNGVETGIFKLASKQVIVTKKKEYGLPEKEYVLALGNLEPRKNLERLIAAYNTLPQKLRETYPLVLIGGDGWRDDGIQASIANANKETQYIYRPSKYVSDEDLAALISGARALVHPALYEGFGIPPLEAMACLVPVASANTASLPEVVGEAALTFNPFDEKAITQALNEVLTNETTRKRLVEAGRGRAELFTWRQSAMKLSAAITQQGNRGYKSGSLGQVARDMYKTTDEGIRKLLGERDFPPYDFPVDLRGQELQKQVHQDFLSEQPKRYQAVLFKAYIISRKTAGVVARSLKAGVKRVKHGA